MLQSAALLETPMLTGATGDLYRYNNMARCKHMGMQLNKKTGRHMTC